MKEVQKLLKLVADGLKSLAQGVEAIADKVDDSAKPKSAGKANAAIQQQPVKPAKAEPKIAEAVAAEVKPAIPPGTKSAPKKAEPVVGKAKGGSQPEKKPAPKQAEAAVNEAGSVSPPEKKPAPKPARKKAVKQPSAMDTVLDIISRSSEGVKVAAIKAETGYEQKKVSNIVYKLKKQGKVKAVKKGVYVKS